MTPISRLLIVIAALAALGYGYNRVSSCRIAMVQSAAAPSGAGSPKQTTPSWLLYPSQDLERTLNLGYATFAVAQDGAITIVPLPPFTPLPATIGLPVAGKHLRARLTDRRCGAAVELHAYRPTQTAAVASLALRSDASAAGEIDASENRFPDGLILTVSIPSSSQNNWFCNVELRWDAKV